MAGSIHKRARAKRDLVGLYVYLAEDAGIETAERFLTDADKSFAAGGVSIVRVLHAPQDWWHLLAWKFAGLFQQPV